MEAVKSDSEAAVSALLHLLPHPPMKAITLAKERGMPGVTSPLLHDTKLEGRRRGGPCGRPCFPTLPSSWTGCPGMRSLPTTPKKTN